jgi:hypothetical protein
MKSGLYKEELFIGAYEIPRELLTFIFEKNHGDKTIQDEFSIQKSRR